MHIASSYFHIFHHLFTFFSLSLYFRKIVSKTCAQHSQSIRERVWLSLETDSPIKNLCKRKIAYIFEAEIIFALSFSFLQTLFSSQLNLSFHLLPPYTFLFLLFALFMSLLKTRRAAFC
jgi:hypothetical protein